MMLDEYKRRLLDEIMAGKKYANANRVCEEKIKRHLEDLINLAKRTLEEEPCDWNEFNFLNIKTRIELILKLISYIKKNYDVINLITSGKIEL